MGIVSHARNRRDADLEAAIALPDGAGTVNSASIDLGAGGVGAAAADVRVGVGSEMARYLRVQITLTGTGNNSGVNGEIRLLT